MPREDVRRVTIDLPAEVYSRLKARVGQLGQNMRRYCTDAIGASLQQEVGQTNCYFAAPDDPGFLNFDREVANAKELWIAGLTLRSLGREFNTALTDRIRSGMKMKVLLLHPDLGPDSYVLRAVQAWVQSDDQAEPVTRLVEDVEESTRFFLDLKRHAPVSSQVEIKGHKRIMSFGLSITDPRISAGRVRINLYLFGRSVSESRPEHQWMGRRHPAIFLGRQTSSAQSMYDVMLEHFRRLWSVGESLS